MNFTQFMGQPKVKRAPSDALMSSMRKSGTIAPGDVHVNEPLSNIVVAYMQDPRNFIAGNAVATVPSLKQSDIYYTFDRSYFNRSEMGVRAPGTESRGAGFAVDVDTPFYCPVASVHVDIPDEVRVNQDNMLNIEMAVSEFLARQALIYKEKKFVNTFFKDGVWASSKDVNWSGDTDNPITDVRAAKTVMAQKTGGFEPNVMVVSRKVLDVILDHPDIIQRLDSGQTPNGPAMADLDKLKLIFGLDEIYVVKSVENTAAEGLAENNAFIGGDHCLLMYKTSAPAIMLPSAGYNFSWTGFDGAGPNGTRITSWYKDDIKSTRYEIESAFDMKLIGSDLGYMFPNAITA